MLMRYDSLITNIDRTKNKMLALIFVILDGKLYAYNNYLKEENKKMVEVTKINGVEVSSFIDSIDVNDLYSIHKMKVYGIDTSKEFVCELLDGEKVIEYDVFDPENSDDVFFKEHDLNEFISSSLTPNIYISMQSSNLMLEYASSNIKGLLSMLRDMSNSLDDKDIFSSILDEICSVDGTYNDKVDNLDVIFLSTQLLLLDSKIDHVPEYIKEITKKKVSFEFDENDNIDDFHFTDGKVDYTHLIKEMRNCIAHSNYRVLSDGIIEFYNDDDKNKLNFTIDKSSVIRIFKSLCDYYYLKGTFPIIYENVLINDPSPFVEESLIQYLKGLELLGTEKFVLRQFDSEEEQSKIDNDLGNDLYLFKNQVFDRESVLRSFNKNIKRHLSSPSEITSKKFNDEDIEYILANVSEMGKDYFYHLGKSSQIEVIHQLIRKKYNREYYIQSNLNEIVNSDYYTNESLTKKSSSYINYKTKVELMITALLNSLMLFCYNKNKSIECSNLRFPMSVYADYLKSKEKNIQDLLEETKVHHCSYSSLLNSEPMQEKAANNYQQSENEMKQIKNKMRTTLKKLKKSNNSIKKVNSIIKGTATDETYKVINLEILNRIRNCLAHGRLTIDIGNLEKIGESKLHVRDEYKGKVNFDTSLSFGELLTTIKDDNFIKSALNNNQNFESHKSI